MPLLPTLLSVPGLGLCVRKMAAGRLILPAALVALALSSLPARAQEEGGEPPLQEVFQTELVYPQERGEIQFTFAPRWSRTGEGRRLEHGLKIEYGLTDRWQVEAEWGALDLREPGATTDARGTSDLRVGTKYSFLHLRNSNFHSAVGFELALPTSSLKKEPEEKVVEYEPYVILARDFPAWDGAQVFTQLSLGLAQRIGKPAPEAEPPAHEFRWSSGMFVPYRQVRFTGEFTWSTNTWNHDGDEREAYLTPGVVWKFGRRWEAGAALPVGLTRGARRAGAAFNLVYEFHWPGRRH